MKKSIFMLVLVAAVVMMLPATASAAGWDTPTAGTSPHGGYTDSTDLCKVCHAVHEAEDATTETDGEILLRSSVSGACDYCHVSANFAGVQKVYNSLPANYAASTGAEHTLGSAIDVPDSGDAAGSADPATDYTIATFNCVSCHAVHGTGAIAASKILKADPYGDGGAATSETTFCADCHDNNLVTVKDLGGVSDQSSHYMGAVTGGAATAASTDCNSCHSGGDGTAANSYPHMTTADYFLVDTFDGTNLDEVCLDCHTGVLP